MSETPEPPNQPEPSALPWKACGANNGECICGMIWDATGDLHVASVMGPNNEECDIRVSNAEMQANKRLIVEAVNNYVAAPAPTVATAVAAGAEEDK